MASTTPSCARCLSYLRELEARRAAIHGSIRDQGKLMPGLEAGIAGAASKAALEDLYLLYKPKRRTKAGIARDKGPSPLAEEILANRPTPPELLAAAYLSDEVPELKEALSGARDILTGRLAENADLLGRLRAFMQCEAFLSARSVKGQEEKGAKFSDHFAHIERWAQVSSHRALAMMRGANEGVLTLDIAPDPEAGLTQVEAMVAVALGIAGSAPGDLWLRTVARWGWRTRLSLTMMLDFLGQLRERAQTEAIRVFARNLRDVLLDAPAGARPNMGLDPGVRTGVKVAMVDATATDTVYPFQPRNDVRGAQATLAALMRRHSVELVAIGNGTASRETEKVIAETLAALPTPKATTMIVSEAGASVYSATERAAKEIARRLQNPLAELVKIEPKAISGGRYQHDVDQHRLGRASRRWSRTRSTLSASTSTWPRHRCSPMPRDSDRHSPETNGLARRIVAACDRDIRMLMGDEARLKAIDPAAFVDGTFGLPTVRDILAELAKPGRDPRPAFVTATEGVNVIGDLKPGMTLEGSVTNVATFGAFIDIGVHQDGLVHISRLADRFVKDPHEVVKAGDVVRVRVVEVDVARKRIGLSMRRGPTAHGDGEERSRARHTDETPRRARRSRQRPAGDRRRSRGLARRQSLTTDLGVQSRGEMVWMMLEAFGLGKPLLRDELEDCQAAVCLEPLGEVVGVEEVAEVRAELVVGAVMVAPDRGILQRSVHALDLTVRPWVVRPGEPMLEVGLGAGELEAVRAEDSPGLRAARISGTAEPRDLGSVKCVPLSVSTVWIR